MDTNVQKVLDIWHKRFEDESLHYSEFEDSDIEYFVGCMLYNHFNFTKALDTMKTIDLSYDFLESCGDSYDEVAKIIQNIVLQTEEEKIAFLQNYIQEALGLYEDDALYLLKRLAYHVGGVAQRQAQDADTKGVDFEASKQNIGNPLLR